MNTFILSSSLAKNSRSYILCQAVEEVLTTKGVHCTFVDARLLNMNPCHRGITPDMSHLAKQIKQADNIIIGMGVHCYSVNDSLKILLDGCFADATEKFFGILCAAGGERSYLSTLHLTQICMNEWRMMQLPRIVYATGKDFTDDKITSKEVLERISQFSNEFYTVGSKLLI